MTMLLEEVLPYLRKGRFAKLGRVFYRIEGGTLQISDCVDSGWAGASMPRLDGFELVPEQFDFLEAVRRMQAGKKVRRNGWAGSCVLEIRSDRIIDTGCKAGRVKLEEVAPNDFLATDWQEVE